MLHAWTMQEILGLDENYLRQQRSLADRFELLDRSNKLSWRHHYEVSSVKTIEEDNAGTLAGRWCQSFRRGAWWK